MTVFDIKLIVVVLRSCDIICRFALVTNKSIEDVEVGCATHYTTFTTSISITVDGGHAVEVEEFLLFNWTSSVSSNIFGCYMFFRTTDDDVRLSQYVLIKVRARF